MCISRSHSRSLLSFCICVSLYIYIYRAYCFSLSLTLVIPSDIGWLPHSARGTRNRGALLADLLLLRWRESGKHIGLRDSRRVVLLPSLGLMVLAPSLQALAFRVPEQVSLVPIVTISTVAGYAAYNFGPCAPQLQLNDCELRVNVGRTPFRLNLPPFSFLCRVFSPCFSLSFASSLFLAFSLRLWSPLCSRSHAIS
jgi:hypothetical protein